MIYEKLFGAIVAVLFGTVFTIFYKRIAKALVLSEHEFWKNIGMKTNTPSEGYLVFAKCFVMFFGISLTIVGLIMFYQFLCGIRNP